MLKNRHFQVKLVKDNEPSTGDPETPKMTKEEATALAKELSKHLAVTVVVIVTASVALNTLGKIAVIAAESAIKR